MRAPISTALGEQYETYIQGPNFVHDHQKVNTSCWQNKHKFVHAFCFFVIGAFRPKNKKKKSQNLTKKLQKYPQTSPTNLPKTYQKLVENLAKNLAKNLTKKMKK